MSKLGCSVDVTEKPAAPPTVWGHALGRATREVDESGRSLTLPFSPPGRGNLPHDANKAVEFYGGVLGFTLKERIRIGMGALDEVIFWGLGDTALEIVSLKNPSPRPQDAVVGYRRMAIKVDNMEEAIAYLKGKGVEISVEPVSLPGGSKRAEIKDPDGLGIELRQW